MAFQEDRLTLVKILQFVESVLNDLVPQIPPNENGEQFGVAWNLEVRPALRELISRIEDMPDANDTRWREIQARGLSGEQLKLKRMRLAAASKKGWRKKILDLLNTILGSIPGADLVKEFKEFTEEALDDIPKAKIKSMFV
jgi:hypothetical protein